MSRDQVERDRLLTEVHINVQHIAEWAKKHDADDDQRFRDVRKDIELGKKILWGGFGIVVFVEFFSRFIR